MLGATSSLIYLCTLLSLGATFVVSRSIQLTDYDNKPQPPFDESPKKWSYYDRLIVAHMTLAMLTFWVAVPVAALVARYGRQSRGWVAWHGGIQAFWTVPAVIVVASLGLAAAGSKHRIFKWNDIHHHVGLAILVLVLLQATGGWMAAMSPVRRSETVNARPLMRVVHPIAGVLIALLGWIQIRLGMNEYGYHTYLLDVLNVILVGGFLAAYGISLINLVRERQAYGRSWFNAMFGLGRAGASPPPRI